MKKWQKVLVVIFSVIVVVAIGLRCLYNFYAKDKIEQALVAAQAVLQDEELQNEIQTFVDELIESGELDIAQLDGYFGYKDALSKEKEQQEAATQALQPGVEQTTVQGEVVPETSPQLAGDTSVITTDGVGMAQDSATGNQNSSQVGNTTKSNNGKVQSSGNNVGKNEILSASNNANPQPSSGTDSKTLMQRVQEAMTPDEFAFAMSMYFKVDTNYIISNMKTNRKGVKEHVKSKLTSDELARSLELYGKYSYLLR